MYGAIIGDLAGSIYEYDQTKAIKSIEINKIIDKKSFYSDDTILTIAIIDAILHDKNYEKYLKKYIKEYENYKPNFEPYFKTAFSPSIIKWANNNYIGTSKGNGAMMRISPIGYLFDTEKEVLENALAATVPSHNSKEAIASATTIALIIFYLRKGYTIKEIYNYLNIPINKKVFTHFNTTCEDTIGNCLYIIYNSNSYEDAIEKTLLLGGDTDTNACIVGSVSEAIYGINEDLINEANSILPKEFIKEIKRTKYYN